MGKGKKRAKSPAPARKMGRPRSDGFVTIGGVLRPAAGINPARFAAASIKYAATAAMGEMAPPTVQTGREWRRRHEHVDECVYHCALTEPQPMIVLCDHEQVASLASAMKNLFPPHGTVNAMQVASVSIKLQRGAIKKSLAKTIFPKRGLIIASREAAMLTKSCLPQGVLCKTVVHVSPTLPTAGEVSIRGELGGVESGSEVNNIFVTQANDANGGFTTIAPTTERPAVFEARKGWMPILQSRCSAARKLAKAQSEGSTLWSRGDRDARTLERATISSSQVKPEMSTETAALAGRVEGLRAKLKVAMSTSLPGKLINDNFNSGSDPVAIAATAVTATAAFGSTSNAGIRSTLESKKSRRSKMQLLGMVHVSSQEEKKFQAQTGRTLAATRWLDETSGTIICAQCSPSDRVNWKSVRFGASKDSISCTVRDVVDGFRKFVNEKYGRKLPKKSCEERQIVQKLPQRTQDTLLDGRITAIGWRPSPFGDEEWGGKFGKCCAHNEVVMFYMRPFAPQEVLNTHVCSRISPAPGNEGYDGCLEFLMAQCAFFKRATTVWDDAYFYHINVKGIVSKFEKAKLLSCSEAYLRFLVPNLRSWTIANSGANSIPDNVAAIKLVRAIGNGSIQVHLQQNGCGILSKKAASIISSYLLIGAKEKKQE